MYQMNFDLSLQIISRLDNVPIVRDSMNYLYATFNLENDWKDHQVTVLFKGKDGQAFNMLLENNTCLVPWEVLTQDYFDVSAFCGNLVTANKVRIFTVESGYEIGSESREPTEEIYEQIIDKLESLNAGEISYDNSGSGLVGSTVQDALDELAQGGGGGGGGTTPNITMSATVDDTTGTPGVEVTKSGTLTNPHFDIAFTGLKGEQGEQGPQGETGATGQAGAPGVGVPQGGTAGQVLVKKSATDYDTEWANGGGGGGQYDDDSWVDLETYITRTHSSGSLKIMRKGNTICVNFASLKLDNGTSGWIVNPNTSPIPQKYWPAEILKTICGVDSGSGPRSQGYISVNAEGGIYYTGSGVSVAGDTITGVLTYLV